MREDDGGRLDGEDERSGYVSPAHNTAGGGPTGLGNSRRLGRGFGVCFGAAGTDGGGLGMRRHAVWQRRPRHPGGP